MNIVITGATSGIGKACAQKLAHKCQNLVLIGRRTSRLEELKAELKDCNIEIITLDVCNKIEVKEKLSHLKDVDVLINNAGLASGMNNLHEGEIDDWEVMIDTNIKGLLYVTRALLPQMVERKKGHIINIGSTAAKDTYPKGNVYCMTKHGVDALSKSMRIELLPYNVKVTAIHPGMVDTEFSTVRFHGDEEKAKKVYENIEPLHAEDIAETIEFIISRPAHVNINDIVMTCTAQANAIFSHRN